MTARFLALPFALTMVAAAAAQTPAPAPRANTTTQQRGRATAPAPPPQSAPAPVRPADGAPPPLPAAPVPPPGMPTPRRENQSTNIRIEVTVTDQRPGVAPIMKTASIVTGDGQGGSVRTTTSYAGSPGGGVPFNVDASPVILADGKIHVRVVLQYDVAPPPGPATPSEVRLNISLRDSLGLVLENSKRVVVVESTDPVSERKVSVEMKATILK